MDNREVRSVSVSTGELIIGLGLVLAAVGYFCPWFEYTFDGRTVAASYGSTSGSLSGLSWAGAFYLIFLLFTLGFAAARFFNARFGQSIPLQDWQVVAGGGLLMVVALLQTALTQSAAIGLVLDTERRALYGSQGTTIFNAPNATWGLWLALIGSAFVVGGGMYKGLGEKTPIGAGRSGMSPPHDSISLDAELDSSGSSQHRP